jgi:hypothetical protein
VIPMEVRHQNVRFDAGCPRVQKLIAQHSDARAAIKDKTNSAWSH